MSDAILVQTQMTYSTPPYIIAEWAAPSVVGGASEMIEVTLPGPSLEELHYRQNPNPNLDGASYAIAVNTFAISCLSGDFDVSVLDINDETEVDTLHEMFKYTGENKVFRDNNLTQYVFRNRDNPQTNKLYIYLTNNDIDTGEIQIEIVFICLQDRPFAQE